jgi:vesicle coat complex subunit
MQDDDPYVRKTAAVCVAKLYDISAELVEDRGFLDMLRVRAPLVAKRTRNKGLARRR